MSSSFNSRKSKLLILSYEPSRLRSIGIDPWSPVFNNIEINVQFFECFKSRDGGDSHIHISRINQHSDIVFKDQLVSRVDIFDPIIFLIDFHIAFFPFYIRVDI